MTPFLLARWKRQATAGREHSPLRKMAIGALIVGGAYALLAIATLLSPTGASWWWIVGYFIFLTLGELYILPTGLGLFARLAPPKLGATTVAAWYLAIFAGSIDCGPNRLLVQQAPAAVLFPYAYRRRVLGGADAAETRSPRSRGRDRTHRRAVRARGRARRAGCQWLTPNPIPAARAARHGNRRPVQSRATNLRGEVE